MKKTLLLLPFGLIAATGIYLIPIQSHPEMESVHTLQSAEELPHSTQELFTYNEHQLNAIIRNGDKQSMKLLNKSLDLLKKKMTIYKHQGYDIQELEKMISKYERDTTFISNTAITHLQQIHQYDQTESNQKAKFLISLEQIGFYELKKSYTNLDNLSKNFIKEPTKEGKIAYDIESSHLKESITELYLDATIEQPLLNYIASHNNYFNTIVTTYNDIGYEKINQLRSNGYSIKAQLQLLPTS